MASHTKWKSQQVLPIIRHNLRRLEDGSNKSNKDIKPELTAQNYALINRGTTCKEVNQYRKSIAKECFKYNRKNLVHAVEIVVQCPADCPPEQHTLFFQECFEHICSTLPMGKKCVFVAEVHQDEKYFTPNGTMISKDHLHIMFVPAVLDNKHDNFQYRLCADALTKRGDMHKFHPTLQAHLHKKGIQATVYRKKEGDGKSISLSVKQLKEITEKTGIVLNASITADKLAKMLVSTITLNKLKQVLEQKNIAISELQETIKQLNQHVHSVNEEHNLAEQALAKMQEKVTRLENEVKILETPKEQSWGASANWGSSTGWNETNKQKDIEVEL